MSSAKGARKHVAMRTCIATGKLQPKRDMVRLVVHEGHIKVDVTGKLGGSRGAYVSKSLSAAHLALQRKKLEAEFEMPVSQEDAAQILGFFAQFAPQNDTVAGKP